VWNSTEKAHVLLQPEAHDQLVEMALVIAAGRTVVEAHERADQRVGRQLDQEPRRQDGARPCYVQPRIAEAAHDQREGFQQRMHALLRRRAPDEQQRGRTTAFRLALYRGLKDVHVHAVPCGRNHAAIVR
jgi:hypothetical protein